MPERLHRLAGLALAAGLALPAATAGAQTARFAPPDSREDVADWVVECYAAPLGQCQIYQRILINNGSAIAMVATFAWDSASQAVRAQIALPLGIALADGAVIAVDDDPSVRLPLDRCTQQGCLIERTMPPDVMARLEQGSVASITVVIPGEGPFTIPMSLTGFGDALARLRPLPATGAGQDAPDERFRPVTGENN